MPIINPTSAMPWLSAGTTVTGTNPLSPVPTGTSVSPFAALDLYKTELPSEAATQNLAAVPDMESLSKLVNQINVQANQARIPQGAELEAASSGNIADLLGGRLSQNYLDTLRSGLAQSWGGRGFGVDTPSLNSAALRAMGLQEEQLKAMGQEQLSAAYARAPQLYRAEEGMVTPAILAQQEQARATLALRAQEMENVRQQWQSELAEKGRQFTESQLQQERQYQQTFGRASDEFRQQMDNAKYEFAAKLGYDYAALEQSDDQFAKDLQYKIDQMVNQTLIGYAGQAQDYYTTNVQALTARMGQEAELANAEARRAQEANQYAQNLGLREFGAAASAAGTGGVGAGGGAAYDMTPVNAGLAAQSEALNAALGSIYPNYWPTT